MNCRSCNARIDYIFLTNCLECGAEVDRGNIPKLLDGPTDLHSPISEQKSFTWKHHLANLAYVLATSLVGMLSGAVVLYFSGAAIYLAFLSGGPGEGCGRGMAFMTLSVLSGAYLGTVGGSIFAVKHLIFKRATN